MARGPLTKKNKLMESTPKVARASLATLSGDSPVRPRPRGPLNPNPTTLTTTTNKTGLPSVFPVSPPPSTVPVARGPLSPMSTTAPPPTDTLATTVDTTVVDTTGDKL